MGGGRRVSVGGGDGLSPEEGCVDRGGRSHRQDEGSPSGGAVGQVRVVGSSVVVVVVWVLVYLCIRFYFYAFRVLWV